MTEHEDERRRTAERQQDGQDQARRTPAEQADDPHGEKGGQVSEVGNLSRADEPVSDDQSVAGSPDPGVDEGPTGPNSRAGSNRN